MTERKVRTVRKPKSSEHPTGWKQRVTEFSYHESVKINLGYNSYSSIELGQGARIKVTDSDNIDNLKREMKEDIHQDLLDESEKKKDEWMQELEIGPYSD